MFKQRIVHDEDLNPQETGEWLESLSQLIDESGPDRAAFLLQRLLEEAHFSGVSQPLGVNTPYVNTIPIEEEVPYPGDRALERRIKSLNRWNAMAMVGARQQVRSGIGGHISTYASLRDTGRSRLQPLFPWRYGDQPRRPGLLPGPRVARLLRPRVSRRAAQREASEEFPP